jgi:uncharacterized protein (TIGR00251 family)
LQLSVVVFPKSGRFEIKNKDGQIKIFLKSPAESNKANLELILKLEKLLKCNVRIVGGFTSRKKILEVPLKEEELKNMLPI